MDRKLEDEIDALRNAVITAKLTHASRDFDAALSNLITKAEKLADVFESFTEILYGQGYQVANWHLNGDLEPMDVFFDNNTAEEVAELRNAILEFKGSVLVQGTEHRKSGAGDEVKVTYEVKLE